MARKENPTLTEQLRAALLASDKTRYRISISTGIDQSVLSRFARGRGGLTLSTADLLADALDLELTPRPPKPRAKR